MVKSVSIALGCLKTVFLLKVAGETRAGGREGIEVKGVLREKISEENISECFIEKACVGERREMRWTENDKRNCLNICMAQGIKKRGGERKWRKKSGEYCKKGIVKRK